MDNTDLSGANNSRLTQQHGFEQRDKQGSSSINIYSKGKVIKGLSGPSNFLKMNQKVRSREDPSIGITNRKLSS